MYPYPQESEHTFFCESSVCKYRYIIREQYAINHGRRHYNIIETIVRENKDQEHLDIEYIYSCYSMFGSVDPFIVNKVKVISKDLFYRKTPAESNEVYLDHSLYNVFMSGIHSHHDQFTLAEKGYQMLFDALKLGEHEMIM